MKAKHTDYNYNRAERRPKIIKNNVKSKKTQNRQTNRSEAKHK